MHILFLTQVLPYPLDAGPKVRAYYVLRYLAQFHKVTLVSFVRPSDRAEDIAHLQQFCAHVHTISMPRAAWLDGAHLLRSLVTSQPFLMARDWVQPMVELLERVTESEGPFDAIHADQLWMAPYALKARDLMSTRCTPVTVLDQHNAVHLIPNRLADGENNWLKRMLLFIEAQKLAHFEATICRQFDHVIWVTQEDYQAVQGKRTESAALLPNSGVIPICVEPQQMNPIQRKTNTYRVTFLGGLHYPPNATGVCWFAEAVFDKILAEVPYAVLTVIGKQPPKRLMQLNIPPQNLDVTGYVTDPTPYLEETAVFIVPLFAGGGMRVKILDAWAWALPIVSTTIGAEGIHVLPGENLLLADSPDDFARATVHILKNRQRGDYLAQSGRRWVEQYYSWQTNYRDWNHIYTIPERQLA